MNLGADSAGGDLEIGGWLECAVRKKRSTGISKAGCGSLDVCRRPCPGPRAPFQQLPSSMPASLFWCFEYATSNKSPSFHVKAPWCVGVR